MSMSSPFPFQLNCSLFHRFSTLKSTLFSSSIKVPLPRDVQLFPLRLDVSKTAKNTCLKLLDAFVDSMFQFVHQPLLPSQSNFAPVDELKEVVVVTQIEGNVPDDFSEGVYIRNGPNPLFGGLRSAVSVFGTSNEIWVEGEGMVHALYFDKASDEIGSWSVYYTNRYVETETLKIEKQRNKPLFLPAIEGNSAAIISAYLLNMLRFGKVNKYLSNTNVFEHGGKFYSIAEHHIPQEIDILTLKTLGNWDVNGSWNRPFTSHSKRAPNTGELVIIGVDGTKPFLELGVISADGKRLIHKVDLKLNRCTLCHDLGVTERYNVIMDFPLTLDVQRLVRGGPLIKYNREEYARIGIMPRYGDGESIRWFDVQPYCIFHILNCFEDNHDEVVVWGCKALDSIIPGPDMGLNKHHWFSTRFKHPYINDQHSSTNGEEAEGSLFSRCHEWRLNMKTGEVKETYLSGFQFSMDFPIINGLFTGLKNRFGYTQILHSQASSISGMAKYGGLAKLYFEELHQNCNLGDNQFEEIIKVEYHKFDKNTFCTGAAFVPKTGADEDDGWIITFVHNEDTNISKAYIIDTKNFSSEPVAKITLPSRVPYGFHGAFMPITLPKLKHQLPENECL
ncbi:carotenoid 9,10(9',10')-cleavage dioxygenase 1-like [Euphorbia lathyris]|uniref:carotenoid 9,10(9',10')-cleavage dioxygenase 1-like n=1 Tax=Euphorbia lathyris TaxID=212925 RepID=UPI0033134ECD